MIEKIIAFSFRQRFFVLLFTIFGMAWGFYALHRIPIDAIPDLSDPQVILFTEWDGRSPDLIEDQITYPIVSSMIAAPRVSDVRGYSMFGMSFVYVLFDEGTDLYWARSRTVEYLAKIRNQLPDGVNPILGPDASGVGWVFQYSIVDESGKNSIEDLRAFQDWKLRYILESIPGVAEVASVGGYVKQYQIQINPYALTHYDLSIQDIIEKVQASNRDVGGRILEVSEREYFVRGLGYLKSIEDIENIALTSSSQGTPVLVKHLARVVIGPDIRRGAIDLNGKGEAASGIVIVRYGSDAYGVIEEVKKALKKVESTLPEGAKIVATYDRSKIIGRSIHTLKKKLLEEMLVVGGIIFLFLWHVRSSLVPILTLPIAVLFSFIPMYYFGVTSNIMSLGGIAIAVGAMVDAAIILVENCHKRLEHWEAGGKKENLLDELLKACQEVARPIFFSLLVIAVSFMPIFALYGQEGRLFKPLAFTKNFSMFFAAILAITLAPVLVRTLLTPKKEAQIKNKFLNRGINFIWSGKIYSEEVHPISSFLYRIYTPVLEFFLKYRVKAVIGAGLLILTVIPASMMIKSEFMPPLNEGDILYMPTTLPGISIEKSKEWLQQQDKIITQFGEVESVFGKIGRSQTATDPAPLSMVETVVQLHPQKKWPKVYHQRWYSSLLPKWLKGPFKILWPEYKRRSWNKFLEDLNTALMMPGTTPYAFFFPIEVRISMLTTGIKTPIGIKLYGDNLEKLEGLAIQLEEMIKQKKGATYVEADRVLGGYYVDVKLKRENLAAYGLTIEDANQLIEGVIGGMNVTTIIDGRARYPVNVRYQQDFRSDLDRLKRGLVTLPNKKHIPLMEIAEVTMTRGPSMIKDENGLLTSWVLVDLDDNTSISKFVREVEIILKDPNFLPKGYTYQISGRYQMMQRAKETMTWVIPLTLFIIVLLLYMNTHSWVRTFIVLLAVPFSLIGAYGILLLLGYKMSVAVAVGIIALAGVDAETGVIMLLYLDLAYQKYYSGFGVETRHASSLLKQAIMEGAVKRVRPKLMTVAALFLGLLPIMWSGVHETGADVMKRIAAPMVGGILTSFIMELLIYPCIYMLWKEREAKKRQ